MISHGQIRVKLNVDAEVIRSIVLVNILLGPQRCRDSSRLCESNINVRIRLANLSPNFQNTGAANASVILPQGMKISMSIIYRGHVIFATTVHRLLLLLLLMMMMMDSCVISRQRRFSDASSLHTLTRARHQNAELVV